MPPTRSIPPAKAVKTERTHEENQERAYIAASRRSDRSLEARVESARRASEIHKRRTGRSLRVTEQDVQNEEMYEEEDDDLPLQYRRLTAHLQTGSADFNRRLSAYLTNHVAMRSALEQSIHNSYAQQFPNAPQYGNQSMFPSPMLAHQDQQPMMQPMMQPPQSSAMYRQAPYPSPRQQQQDFSFNTPQRSASIAVPQQSSSASSNTNNSPVITSDNGRSMSMSAGLGEINPTDDFRSPMSATSSTPQPRPPFPPDTFAQNQMPQNQFSLPSYDMGAFGNSIYPAFSTQLPAETQGFIGSTFDVNDPLMSMMMAGSNNLSGNYYNFNNLQMPQAIDIGKYQMHPSFDGLNSTLAPEALDKQVDNVDQNLDFFDGTMTEKDASTGTPGLNGDSWDSWINDNQWDMPTAFQ